ncbi:MAG TPA: ABC transporter ATP-binding protein [Stellaceae bacterium]|nr:ABC transporter ATP-binding protein [Stellaceae bacterium]
MASLTLEAVSKRFPGAAAPAVDGVDLAVRDGEFLAILGASGCGKTTLLRLAAGFERPTAGRILLDDRLVADAGRMVPAERRGIGIVFQSYALWPHMDVAGNVGYALAGRGVRGAEYDRQVEAALAAVGLTGFGARRPGDLSGGQRQRVALARCLAMAPGLVLLDEPLANLDVHLKASLQDEFAAFRVKTGATMVYITHDQAEAMALADRIAVMATGRIVQLAAPELLYREPATPLVAGFIGKGAVLPATVIGPVAAGRVRVEIAGLGVVARAQPDQRPGPALLCVRPEDLALVGADEAGIAAVCRRALYQGGGYLIELDVEAWPDLTLPLVVPPGIVLRMGESLRLTIRDGWVIPNG